MNAFLENITSSPKKMFLLDGLGALLTAFSTGVILVTLEAHFGMPRKVLYYLALVACVFAVYSLSCHFFLPNNWQLFLLGIMFANILYCSVTLGLVIYFYEMLSILGLLYFIGEIIVVMLVVVIERKTIFKSN